MESETDTASAGADDGEGNVSLHERYRRRLSSLTARYALLNAEVAGLTGFSSVEQFSAWKVGALTSAPLSSAQIFLLIGVLERLKAAFPNAEQGTGWLHRPNAKFGNLSPLQVMLSGDVPALGNVAVHLALETPKSRSKLAPRNEQSPATG